MTTTELAVIEGTGEVEPLSEGKAKQLDKRIRSASDRFVAEGDKLLDLLTTAAQGQIHLALGYASWTAYVKDAVDFKVSDREERKALAVIMSGKGMSQRAIAGALGVSQKTVDRDLDGESFDSDTVTTLDGKTTARNKPKKEADNDGVIDAEVIDVEEEADPDAPRKPADVVADFEQPVLDLVNDIQAMKDILNLDADLLPKARKRLAQRYQNRIQTGITDLTAILEQLTED